MSQYWDTLSQRSNGLVTSDELAIAAYRLVNEQVLYHSDKKSRNAYSVVERYEREIKKALEPLGIIPYVNRQLRYVFAKPQYEKAGIATTSQTLLALVLRALYEEHARNGELNQHGEVICDLIELEEKYRLSVDREFPARKDIDNALKALKRWGIAKKSIDTEQLLDDQPFVIVIRPAILDVLGETALKKLALWSKIDEDGEVEINDKTNELDTESMDGEE